MSPGKKRVHFKSLHSALTRVSAALAEQRNLQARVAAATPAHHFNSPTQYRQFRKLAGDLKKARQRYHQLARRVLYHNGSRNLNSRPLTQREREAIRASGAIVRNMSAARRTVRHIPLPHNLRMLIIRSAARR